MSPYLHITPVWNWSCTLRSSTATLFKSVPQENLTTEFCGKKTALFGIWLTLVHVDISLVCFQWISHSDLLKAWQTNTKSSCRGREPKFYLPKQMFNNYLVNLLFQGLQVLEKLGCTYLTPAKSRFLLGNYASDILKRFPACAWPLSTPGTKVLLFSSESFSTFSMISWVQENLDLFKPSL